MKKNLLVLAVFLVSITANAGYINISGYAYNNKTEVVWIDSQASFTCIADSYGYTYDDYAVVEIAGNDSSTFAYGLVSGPGDGYKQTQVFVPADSVNSYTLYISTGSGSGYGQLVGSW